jgi:CIC family chloride channel protein
MAERDRSGETDGVGLPASQEPTDRMVRRFLRSRGWARKVRRPAELPVHLIWAGVIGVVGALAAHGFREGTDALHALLTGEPGNYVDSFARLPWWRRLLVPVLGGALAGAVLHFGARLRRRPQSADYMEAIVVGDGRVAGRASLVKILSALFSYASGASIGREGPLVQLSAVLASFPARWSRISLQRRRQLVACGAAAGIASAYNAPIGGAFFVAEIVLGTLAMESFGPLVVSSVVATVVTRVLAGPEALYEAPSFALFSYWELAAYLNLGILCGLLAPGYVQLLRSSEGVFQRLRLHRIAKLALGGAIVGGLAIAHPEVCGNGYSVVFSILHDPWAWQAVLVILLFKVVATGATFGSGAVGGVFTPTLLAGAALGYLFASGANGIFPALELAPGAYALVGMGAFLAAATGAPVMALIMIFEFTLNYEVVLPVMLACVFGYYTCRSFGTRFLYNDALERKGAAVVAERLAASSVGELMRRDVVHVPHTATFREVCDAFLQNRFDHLYVVDEEDRYLGAISLHEVKEHLGNPELASVLIARDLLHPDFPAIAIGTPLEDALHELEELHTERLPVIFSREDPRLVGRLAQRDLLRHLSGRGGA